MDTPNQPLEVKLITNAKRWIIIGIWSWELGTTRKDWVSNTQTHKHIYMAKRNTWTLYSLFIGNRFIVYQMNRFTKLVRWTFYFKICVQAKRKCGKGFKSKRKENVGWQGKFWAELKLMPKREPFYSQKPLVFDGVSGSRRMLLHWKYEAF